MDRSKIVAIITGAIALLLGIAYLIIVQLLDFRGEMLPAPTDLSLVNTRGIGVFIWASVSTSGLLPG
jgi:hypothetical protein